MSRLCMILWVSVMINTNFLLSWTFRINLDEILDIKAYQASERCVTQPALEEGKIPKGHLDEVYSCMTSLATPQSSPLIVCDNSHFWSHWWCCAGKAKQLAAGS